MRMRDWNILLCITWLVCMTECCPKPEIPENGYLTLDLDTYSVNDSVTLLCRNGYVPNGRNYAVCQSDGLWDHLLPACEEDLAYGMSATLWNEVTGSFLAYIHQSTTGNMNCNQISPLGDAVRLEIDLENVYFIGHVIIALEGVEAGVTVATADIQNGEVIREKICHHFDQNLTRQHGINVECHSLGRWIIIHLPASNNSVTVCKIQVTEATSSIDTIGCSKPKLPNNSYLTRDREKYNVGYTITMLCEEGFAPVGRNFATCQPDGFWDHPLPLCEKNVAFMKSVYLDFWEDSVKDFRLIKEASHSLTDSRIDTCRTFPAGQDQYLEVYLETNYDIYQISLAFDKPGVHVDLQISIANTIHGRKREHLCEKISQTVGNRGIVVPCRYDESRNSPSIQGNMILIRLNMSKEPITICKIQAFSTKQQIATNGSDQSLSWTDVNNRRNSISIPSFPEDVAVGIATMTPVKVNVTRDSMSTPSFPEDVPVKTVKVTADGFSNLLFLVTIILAVLSIILITALLCSLFCYYRQKKYAALESSKDIEQRKGLKTIIFRPLLPGSN